MGFFQLIKQRRDFLFQIADQIVGCLDPTVEIALVGADAFRFHRPDGHTFMDDEELVNALSLIAAVVDPAVQFLFRKLLIAEISTCLPPMLQGGGASPIGSRNSVEYIVSCFVPDALPMLVKQIFPPLLVAPFPVRQKGTNEAHDMKMGIGNTAFLLVGLVYGEVHHHTTAHKVFQQKLPCKGDVLLHGEFVLQGNVKTVCKLCFFPCSASSTAFQRVCRSAYSGGAWGGSRISEQTTPPLLV